MAALPPRAPSPSPSNPCLKSTSPKAEQGTDAVGRVGGQGFDGGEPEHGTEGVGRVGGQGIDGGEPPTRTDGGGDPQMPTDAGSGKRPRTAQCKISERNQRKKPNESSLAPTIIKGASPGLRSPMQVTSSPGVNYLVKSAAVKRANMAGSPKTPQPPRCSQLGSPSLENLSPHTRATNSQASKRKRRKLISEIWREAEPIYKDGKLVEGKCNHCHQTFAASRDTGTSHMKRHLKVLEVFYTATKTLSGSKYPTSHLHFYQLWNIKKLLNKEGSILNRKIETVGRLSRFAVLMRATSALLATTRTSGSYMTLKLSRQKIPGSIC